MTGRAARWVGVVFLVLGFASLTAVGLGVGPAAPCAETYPSGLHQDCSPPVAALTLGGVVLILLGIYRTGVGLAVVARLRS